MDAIADVTMVAATRVSELRRLTPIPCGVIRDRTFSEFDEAVITVSPRINTGQNQMWAEALIRAAAIYTHNALSSDAALANSRSSAASPHTSRKQPETTSP